MPTLKIDEDTHLLIKQYCILKGVKLESFVRDIFKNNPELLKFRSELKKIKFG